jgi:Flp pilus assembly protein TadD
VVRDGLGEVRRTVVVSPSLADARGVVATEIPYSVDDTGAMISMHRLAVPRDAADLYSQAREHLARQDAKGALRLLRRAVERAPDFADAWNTLGVLAFQSGDFEEAERCYRQAAQDRQAFDATLNLGALLLRTGRAAEAIDYNLRAVEIRRSDAAANVQLGMNYFQLGRLAEAEQYLTQAERLDPAHPAQPQLFLAEIYRQRGDAARASAELRTLIRLRPDAALAEALREKLGTLAAR